ncbi:alpha/beta fold hydrolase [Jannaschia sp. LMIT008]|uniref:alpha/beta fold hydrolase n=1 Tax=Jannaschia maritima TaxID=3032585 RepID=UPI0028116FF6|nr:dienelactone hydrolase-related enzyme [Jannaschia sp. LMIT008]
MLHKMLDLWDERRAARADPAKRPMEPIIDASLPFPNVKPATSLNAFCAMAEDAANEPSFFTPARVNEADVRWKDDRISFPSPLISDLEANNTVHASVEAGKDGGHALVVFHHWNAQERSDRLARYFAAKGVTVVQMALPYHMERRRPGTENVDDILSADLGRTLRSMRQAVLDGRALIGILKDGGFDQISVLGMSVGSWVAGLVAAHDERVHCAGLFLSAGSLADVAWTGRATRHIHTSLDGVVELDQLRRTWAPLDLAQHTSKLARPELTLQFVLGKRDTVVPPDLSERLLSAIRNAGGDPRILWLNCGHYSLSLPPYILWAGRSMAAALTGSR